MPSLSLGLSLPAAVAPVTAGEGGGGEEPGNGPFYYLRPDGVSRYLRPDGTSFYLRP
jgi:hypothetical protein